MAQSRLQPGMAIPGPTSAMAPAVEGAQMGEYMEAKDPKKPAGPAWHATRAGTLEPGATHCRTHTIRSMNEPLQIKPGETQSSNTRESVTRLTNQPVDRI